MSIASGGTNLLASIAARYLPWLGFTPHQPVHIQAVYLPVWMVDAHVDADVWIQNERQNRLQNYGTYMYQSYMPGFVFEPLSSLSLAHPAYTQFNNVRFSEDLETQHGSDILCLPFTHTPFKLIDLARSLSYEEATTTEPKPLRFDPESVKERLIAAYPLLLPVYIARYELRLLGHQPEEPISYTVVVEAHSKKGRIIVENIHRRIVTDLADEIQQIPGESDTFLATLVGMFPNEGVQVYGPYSSHADRFVGNIRSDDVPASFDKQGAEAVAAAKSQLRDVAPNEMGKGYVNAAFRQPLRRWINAAASRNGALEEYRRRYFDPSSLGPEAAAPVDWEDPRIREHTQEETLKTELWMRLCEYCRRCQLLLSEFESKSLTHGKDGVAKRLEDAKQFMEKSEPSWLAEWRSRSGEKPLWE